MEELSLHILDIVQNSIAAGATLIEIEIAEDTDADTLTVTIKDNGKGMSEETVKAVTDPFTTSRSTRRVGLGIPLLKLAAELTGGKLEISSELAVGTIIKTVFGHSHIDRQPLGDMASTIHQLVVMNEAIDFLYTHKVNSKEISLDTKELRNILGEVAFSNYEVSLWILEYLREQEKTLYQSERNG